MVEPSGFPVRYRRKNGIRQLSSPIVSPKRVPLSWTIVPTSAFCFAASLSLLLLVASGCGDNEAKPAEDVSSPDAQLSESPDANPPTPPDKPAVNIQFVGAANLSDESKSTLADVIESIQGSVVQIVVGGGSGSGFIVDEGGLARIHRRSGSGQHSKAARRCSSESGIMVL